LHLNERRVRIRIVLQKRSAVKRRELAPGRQTTSLRRTLFTRNFAPGHYLLQLCCTTMLAMDELFRKALLLRYIREPDFSSSLPIIGSSFYRRQLLSEYQYLLL
jgi:hypothetical protein